MRYTTLLGRIFKAARQLKADNAHIDYAEAVANQILMWKQSLADYYDEKELLKIQVILGTYLEVN